MKTRPAHVLKGLLGAAAVALLATVPSPTGAADRNPAAAQGPDLPNWLTLTQPRPARVYLSGIEFLMGSTHEEAVEAFASCSQEPLGQSCRMSRFSSERPERKTRVSGFWLGRHEVTFGEFEDCVRVGRCPPLPYWEGANAYKKHNLPAVLVRHEDASRYCAFRNGRLPTEAEFERAARGAERRRYPWGDLYNPRVSNHGALALTLPFPTEGAVDVEDGFAELAPVGSFPAGATPEGVEDLAGNVREWVSDWFAPYDPDERSNPRGPAPSPETTVRVLRGGGFDSARSELRGASREWTQPQRRSLTIGFRCAWDHHLRR